MIDGGLGGDTQDTGQSADVSGRAFGVSITCS
jgi:hypothetical protein